MKIFRILLVVGLGVFSSSLFGQSVKKDAGLSIKVEKSDAHYVKVSVDQDFVGGDYFITDRSGVMVAIGKLRNATVEYFPSLAEGKELVFNAVNRVKGASASKLLVLR